MSLHNDLVYVAHMRDTAHKVIQFTAGLSYETFLENEMAQWAVVRGIEVVGEASTKVSSQFCQEHPDWPWKGMRGMRNALIHGYANVDLGIVWDVVTHELPEIHRLTTAVLKEEPGQPR